MAKFLIPIAALASEALMLHTGRRNPSIILLAIFTIWVLAPFVALYFASVLRPRINNLVMIVSLGSLAAYALAAFGPPLLKPAALFLIVPPISGMLLAAALLYRPKER